MTEKKLVIDGLELHYAGLFDLDELLKEIDKACAERGYTKNEKRRVEITKPEGKEFSIELRPTKRKTEYFVLMLKIRIDITNLKEVDIIKDNRRARVQEGKVDGLFDAWTTSWYEFRWEQKPLYYFLRNMYERFVKIIHTDIHDDEVADDCHYVHTQVKAFLNLHQFLEASKKR